MRFRLDHSHGDKECFIVTGAQVMERQPPGTSSFGYYGAKGVTDAALYLIGGERVILVYHPYTGHWRAFDPDAGDEIASFTRRFYDRHLAHSKVSALVPDPDCLVAK